MVKSCFLWEIRQNANTYSNVLRAIKKLGVNRIEIKAADGTRKFMEPAWCPFGLSRNLAPELRELLRHHGIDVFGWGFNYGKDPEGEGDIAAQERIFQNLDGWVFDVESKFFEHADVAKRIHRMMRAYREIDPAGKIGFAAFPRWHNPAPPYYEWWKKSVYVAAAEYIDFWEPMSYWGAKWGTTPAGLALDAIKQHKEIKDLPVINAGRGWSDGAGKVTPEAVREFTGVTMANGGAGVSWWVSHLILKRPEIVDAIRQIGDDNSAIQPDRMPG
jgi:hypothetical protein